MKSCDACTEFSIIGHRYDITCEWTLSSGRRYGAVSGTSPRSHDQEDVESVLHSLRQPLLPMESFWLDHLSLLV